MLRLILFLLFSSTAFSQSNIVFTEEFSSGASNWRRNGTNIHDFNWYATAGINGTGGLRTKFPSDSNYVASPYINLSANKTYTLSYKSRIDQSNSLRKMKVFISTNQYIKNSTLISENILPANSYATPGFSEFNPTFTVPANGNYVFIFKIEESGYLFTYLDDVLIEETIVPTTEITLPANNSTHNEGQDLIIGANASDQDGSISKVEFYIDNKKVFEDLSSPYSFSWIDILPGDYILQTKAYDNRGNVNMSSPISTRMNLRDGSFSKYEHFNFNTSTNNTFDYWTLNNGDYKTRPGWHGTPCIEIFSAYNQNFIASPGIYLKAGVNYTFETLVKGNVHTLNASINTSPTLGGTLIGNINFLATDDFNAYKTINFNVPSNGVYYLIINYPGQKNYMQLKLDNIRIIGDLEVLHKSKISFPTENLNTVNTANILLRTFIDPVLETPVQKVEYFANSLKIGESSTFPFDFLWQNLNLGTYDLTSKVLNNQGLGGHTTKVKLNVGENNFSQSSYLGSIKNDEIRAGEFQKDGILVLAANIPSLPNIPTYYINNAVDSSMGTVLRLTSDGKHILSQTKVDFKISDLALDQKGNIYVSTQTSALSGKLLKLNSEAKNLIFEKSFSKSAIKVDASKNGNVAVLTSIKTNLDENTLTDVNIYVYDSSGTALFNRTGISQYTPDLAIDDENLVVIGFKNFNTPDPSNAVYPVFVPVIKTYSLTGALKYAAYDWESDKNSLRWLNRSNNNMADVRTSKVSIGKDGFLYVLYEIFGGNHVLRYDPFDIMDTVSIVGGDNYFNLSNTGTECKIFIGKYNINTGAYIKGQQLTARLNTPPYKGNTIFARNGSIKADEDGRVYFVGKSASGYPQTADFLPGEYTGGAVLTVFSPGLNQRELSLRLTNGDARFVAVYNKHRIAYGGSTNQSLFTKKPYTGTKNVGIDGFWATIDRPICESSHYLGGNIDADLPVFKTSDKIKSLHILNSGTFKAYEANKSIELLPGFESKIGSIFKAEIKNCQN